MRARFPELETKNKSQSNEVIRELIRESLFKLYKHIQKSTVKHNLRNGTPKPETIMSLYSIQKSIRNQLSEFKIFLDYVDSNVMKLSHETPDVLLTGQAIASWVLADFNIHMIYNDIDIFVLDTTSDSNKIRSVGLVPITNKTSDASEYSGLFKGYSIATSVKVVKNSTLNVTAVTPKTVEMYNVYNDEHYNYKSFAENIIGTFDLNLNKIGFLTNKWLTEFNPIISDEFVEFIASRQFKLTHSLNSKFLIRYYDKLHRIKSEIKTKTLYFDEKDIFKLLGIQNQIHNRMVTFSPFDPLTKSTQNPDNLYRITPANSSLYLSLIKLDTLIRSLLIDKIEVKFNPKEHIEYSGHFSFKIGFENWYREELLGDVIKSYSRIYSIRDKNRLIAEDVHEYNLAIEYMYSTVSKKKIHNIISHLFKKKVTDSLNRLYDFIGILVRFPTLLSYPLNQIREVATIFTNHSEFEPFLSHQSKENTIKIFDLVIRLNEYIESDVFDDYRMIVTKNSKVTYIYQMLRKYRHYPLSVIKLELLAWVEADFEDKTKSLVSREAIKFNIIDEDVNIQVSELTSTMELTREGEVMNHCVGGYSTPVRNGKTLIFKIESEIDDSLRYTFELRLDCPENQLRLIQVRGKRNKDVEQHHQKFVDVAINRAIKIASELDLCDNLPVEKQAQPFALDDVIHI